MPGPVDPSPPPVLPFFFLRDVESYRVSRDGGIKDKSPTMHGERIIDTGLRPVGC